MKQLLAKYNSSVYRVFGPTHMSKQFRQDMLKMEQDGELYEGMLDHVPTSDDTQTVIPIPGFEFRQDGRG